MGERRAVNYTLFNNIAFLLLYICSNPPTKYIPFANMATHTQTYIQVSGLNHLRMGYVHRWVGTYIVVTTQEERIH